MPSSPSLRDRSCRSIESLSKMNECSSKVLGLCQSQSLWNFTNSYTWTTPWNSATQPSYTNLSAFVLPTIIMVIRGASNVRLRISKLVLQYSCLCRCTASLKFDNLLHVDYREFHLTQVTPYLPLSSTIGTHAASMVK